MELLFGALIVIAIAFAFIYSVGNYIDAAPERAAAYAANAVNARRKRDEIEKKRAEFLDNAESRLNELIQQHIKVLAIKWQQTITKDAYGVLDASGWNSERDYFFHKVLFTDPDLFPYLSGAASGNYTDSEVHIDAQIAAVLAKQAKGERVPQHELDSIETKVNNLKSNYAARKLEAKKLIHDLVF